MPGPTIFSYTIRDSAGVEATFRAYANFDGTVETVDGLTGEWAAMGALVDGVTGGKIIGGQITIPQLPAGGWKSAPVAGSDVEQTGTANFSNATTQYMHPESVPALLDTLISGGRIIVGSGAFKTFTDALVAGFTNGNWVNTAAQGLVAAVDAFVSFRKHRRQRNKVSFETPG